MSPRPALIGTATDAALLARTKLTAKATQLLDHRGLLVFQSGVVHNGKARLLVGKEGRAKEVPALQIGDTNAPSIGGPRLLSSLAIPQVQQTPTVWLDYGRRLDADQRRS